MYIFEKIFQRNDKFILLIYYSFLSLSLYFTSITAYYIRNEDWNITESYAQGSILIVLIFLLISIFNSKEDRFIRGPAQWFRVEFVFLLQSFFIAILLTVIFKVTNNYSRVWLFTNLGLSIFVFLLLKIFFDFVYTYLIKSNSIQRNVILVGDASACQNIIKSFPKKKSTSVIKCVISIDHLHTKD